MESNDIVSVIIPIYKIEEVYLRESIESVINQTYHNIDIVLVDDGSPDNCGIICDEYMHKDRRINVIHKENGGVSSARNTGIKNSKGNWVLFLDPDDILNDSAVEKMISTISGSNDVDMIIACYQEIVDGIPGKIFKNKGCILSNDKEIQQLAKYMICRSYPCNEKWFAAKGAWGACWGKLIKKELIIKSRIMFEEDLHPQEDVLFITQIISKCQKLILLNVPVEYYRIHRKSVLQKVDYKAIDNDIHFLKALNKSLKELGWNDLNVVLNGGCITIIGDILKRYYAHLDNEESFGIRKARMEKLLDNEFIKNAIQDKSNYLYGTKQKLIIFLLNNRMLFTLYVLGRIRNGIR